MPVDVDLSPARSSPSPNRLGGLPRGAAPEQAQDGALDVVVSGPGPIGMTAALLLSQRGHHVVLTGAERDRALRLTTAASLGLKTLVADEAADLTPDGWIEASGSSHGLGAALRQTMPGGTVVVPGLFGAPADPDVNLLTRREICLKGSYGSQAEDYRHAMGILGRGPPSCGPHS